MLRPSLNFQEETMQRIPLSCEAVIVACEDFRLHQRSDGSNLLAEFIKDLGYDCDVITRGGGILDYVRPHDVGHGFDGSVLRDLKVAVKLHDVKNIIIVGHEDCRAYGYLHFKCMESEMNRVQADMRIARNALKKEFPRVQVLLYLAKLVPGSVDRFVLEEMK